MAHSFVAYIDESGDDGIANFRTVGGGGTSQWLIISACVVSAANDPLMPSWRNEITSQFVNRRRRDLHFSDIDHSQRVFTCESLSKKPVRLFSVMSNKTTIPDHPRIDLFAKKNTLYWYLTRYLVERISRYCERRAGKHDGDGTVKIIFSRRGGMSYDNFRNYLHRLKSKQEDEADESVDIFWPAIDIDAVDALDHKNRAGLQMADIVAGAFAAGVEPNPYGGFEHRYAQTLAPRVAIAADGHYLGFGVKFVPRLDQMQLAPEQLEFFRWFREKRR